MMPIYEYDCRTCGWSGERYRTLAEREHQTCKCGAALTQVLSVSVAQPDDIPGGFVQEHFGHTPEVFYSRSEMARRAKELGLQPFVRHQPRRGSDKSEVTTRWV